MAGGLTLTVSPDLTVTEHVSALKVSNMPEEQRTNIWKIVSITGEEKNGYTVESRNIRADPSADPRVVYVVRQGNALRWQTGQGSITWYEKQVDDAKAEATPDPEYQQHFAAFLQQYLEKLRRHEHRLPVRTGVEYTYKVKRAEWLQNNKFLQSLDDSAIFTVVYENVSELGGCAPNTDPSKDATFGLQVRFLPRKEGWKRAKVSVIMSNFENHQGEIEGAFTRELKGALASVVPEQ
jgi:hypothetical protein